MTGFIDGEMVRRAMDETADRRGAVRSFEQPPMMGFCDLTLEPGKQTVWSGEFTVRNYNEVYGRMQDAMYDYCYSLVADNLNAQLMEGTKQ